MLLWCSINIQSFLHDKSSSIPQFFNSISKNLKKLLKNVSGIVTLTFKVNSAGRFASPSFPGRAGLFRTIFVLHLNDVKNC